MEIVEEYKTIQGEGKYTGVPSYFIRTTGCNLRCAWKNQDNSITICDTPYTSYNPEKGRKFEMDKTMETLKQSKIEHIVITGGEPTLQPDLNQVISTFLREGYHVTTETNGIVHVPNAGFMSLSPKLKSSYFQQKENLLRLHARNNHFLETCAKYMNQEYQFKFVGNDHGDLDEILDIQKQLGIPNKNIYIMPQGIRTEQFKQKEEMLINFCVENGFNYSPRLHIDIWGHKRGV